MEISFLAARAKYHMEKLRSLASSRWVLINCTVRSTNPRINQKLFQYMQLDFEDININDGSCFTGSIQR